MRIIDEQLLSAVAYLKSQDVFDKIKQLLDDGAKINCQVDDELLSDNMKIGMTPFMIAILEWRYDVAKQLIEYGADLEINDANGNTAFHHAAKSGMIRGMQVMIKNRADINAKNYYGDTPLHILISCAGVGFETVRMMLQNGSDILSRNNRGITPYCLSQTHKMDEKIKLLIQAKHEEIHLGQAIKDSMHDRDAILF